MLLVSAELVLSATIVIGLLSEVVTSFALDWRGGLWQVPAFNRGDGAVLQLVIRNDVTWSLEVRALRTVLLATAGRDFLRVVSPGSSLIECISCHDVGSVSTG